LTKLNHPLAGSQFINDRDYLENLIVIIQLKLSRMEVSHLWVELSSYSNLRSENLNTIEKLIRINDTNNNMAC
jgi:hypothetical protein